ncbi:hypothetical protein HH310_10895 [Actinoplanes sp. TBRC 11911]|uniref:hypothetical protein n=1 Tax=Actinoplanes sp. TBRC 11911 TaxID=2729386 RepID=UPI00145CBB15|nr:hypothetical protein [Actinoplanes sp. TBRC 11911]NMO51696.1 hypothetical protein [Actinoplanes sp. TBRC 11911]
MSSAPTIDIRPVGGPVWVAWREGTLTRAKELEALAAWVRARHPAEQNEALGEAIACHLEAARDAAMVKPMRLRTGPLMERASSNLDAAEAHILNIAPPEYVLGQMACLLRHVQCHLPATDPGRQNFERIARTVGVDETPPPVPRTTSRLVGRRARPDETAGRLRTIDSARGAIVTTVRSASSAALRELIRLRSFRNVVVVTTVLMTVLALGVALTGLLQRSLIPLCFAPEESGTAVVVCPTAQSDRFTPSQDGGTAQSGAPVRDIDTVVAETTRPEDLLIVELVGLTAAAIATAAAIRRIKGTSERYGIPVALAALKLPTGALTAFLGLLLMRGQFVPGLSALDTSAQILAWALVFGYAQQLFTRLVDQQGQTVLNSVRVPDAPVRPGRG